MKGNMEERACALAAYIIENRATVRAAAKKFGVSKSTVHKDLQDRLPQFDLIVRKYDCVHTMPSVFLVTTYYYIGKPPSFQHKKIRR